MPVECIEPRNTDSLRLDCERSNASLIGSLIEDTHARELYRLADLDASLGTCSCALFMLNFALKFMLHVRSHVTTGARKDLGSAESKVMPTFCSTARVECRWILEDPCNR